MHEVGVAGWDWRWRMAEEFRREYPGADPSRCAVRAEAVDEEERELADEADAAEVELYEAALRARLERECRTGMLEVAREAGFWVRGPVLPGARTRRAQILSGEEPMPKEWT